MREPIHKGKDLPPIGVLRAASGGDSEAMERVLRYYDDYMSRLCTRTLYDKDGTPHVCVDAHYDDYMSRLCTRTLYDKDGTPHVCVDAHMKRCLEIRLIRAVMRA